ncbi:MAG: hydrogenase maturation protease [Spirochaetales bacterium]|nr:hydrogenase maturation protease [Spirochaetales bacterium]
MKLNEKCLVLGIGNELRGDDGIGLYLVREMEKVFPAGYGRFREAGAWGMDLVHEVAEYENVFLIDGIEAEDQPIGTLFEWDANTITESTSVPSLHSHGLSLPGIINLGLKLGLKMPDQFRVFAVAIPFCRDFTQGLSRRLKNRFHELAARLKSRIEEACH